MANATAATIPKVAKASANSESGLDASNFVTKKGSKVVRFQARTGGTYSRYRVRHQL